MSDAQFQVNEDLPDHTYRTEIPNIIFEIKLNPYTFMVYSFLKKVAGDSNGCFYSKENMAKQLGMSVRKLQESIKDLISGNNFLQLKLIREKTRKSQHGGDLPTLYTIINIWPENGRFYKKKPKEGGVHNVRGEGAPRADKEEPLEEEPCIKTTTTPTPSNVVVVSSEEKFLKQVIHCVNFFAKKATLWKDDKWNLPYKLFRELILQHGYEYVVAQIQYITDQHIQALKDERSSKVKKTPLIGKPLLCLKMACAKNYAEYQTKE